jgi:hypothetical protein
MDYTQDNLLKKITAFLKYQAESIGDSIDTPEIRYFAKSKGECNGLVSLWAYGRRISDKENTTGVQRDDAEHFWKMYETLINWDEQTQFTTEQVPELERFISHIKFFQYPALEINDIRYQTDLSKAIQDTTGNQFVETARIDNLVVKKDMLLSRIEKFLQPKTIVCIGGSGSAGSHVTSIYTDAEGKIHFFDPNSYVGEKIVEDSAELMRCVWDALTLGSTSGFRGTDLVSIFLRDISIESYKLEEDVQGKIFQREDLKLTNDEFLEIIDGAKILMNHKDHVIMKDLVKSLDESQVLELYSHSDDTRSLLGERFLEAKKLVLDAIRGITDKPADPTDLINKALSIKNFLKLGDKIDVIKLSGNDPKVIDEIFSGSKNLPSGNFDYISVEILVGEYLKAGQIDLAHLIIDKVADQYNLLPDARCIFRWNNIEFAESINQKFRADVKKDSVYSEDRYLDRDISYMKTRKLQSDKDKIGELLNSHKDIKPEIIQELNADAEKYAENLSFREAIYFAKINVGKTKIVEDLFKSASASASQGFVDGMNGIYCVHNMMFVDLIKDNIKIGHLDTAKAIIKIAGEKFKAFLRPKEIVELQSKEIAHFVEEELGKEEFYCKNTHGSHNAFLHHVVECMDSGMSSYKAMMDKVGRASEVYELPKDYHYDIKW